MQASNVIMAYFVIGAVMIGGGALDLGNAGVVGAFIESDHGQVNVNETASGILQDQTNAITRLATLAVGGIVFAVQLISLVLAYMNWPVVVLLQHNAPPALVILLGGSFVSAFYLSMLSIIGG